MRTTRWKIALVSSALIGAHASAPALAAQDTAPLAAPAATAEQILCTRYAHLWHGANRHSGRVGFAQLR